MTFGSDGELVPSGDGRGSVLLLRKRLPPQAAGQGNRAITVTASEMATLSISDWSEMFPSGISVRLNTFGQVSCAALAAVLTVDNFV